MMPLNAEIREVRKDMLHLGSTVQEVLRSLYFYRSDYIMVALDKKERLLHKDQLVALLEQGRENATVEDMPGLALTAPISAKTAMEDIPPESGLIVFSDDGLYGTTFEAYREMKIREAAISLPEWWGIPLPLLYLKDGRVSLNEAALPLVPCGAQAIAGQIEKIKSEKLISIKDKKKEKVLSLSPLDAETFLIEDVSEDFDMVEDLVWWAAIGSAFVRRMEENGLTVRRMPPHGQTPQEAAEIIPCHWEGELIGRLAIEVPAQGGPDGAGPPAPDAGKDGKVQEAQKTEEEAEKTEKTDKEDRKPEAQEPKKGRRGAAKNT